MLFKTDTNIFTGEHFKATFPIIVRDESGNRLGSIERYVRIVTRGKNQGYQCNFSYEKRRVYSDNGELSIRLSANEAKWY